MEYIKYGETYYIRMDRGDKIVSVLMDVCRKEGIFCFVKELLKNNLYTFACLFAR